MLGQDPTHKHSVMTSSPHIGSSGPSSPLRSGNVVRSGEYYQLKEATVPKIPGSTEASSVSQSRLTLVTPSRPLVKEASGSAPPENRTDFTKPKESQSQSDLLGLSDLTEEVKRSDGDGEVDAHKQSIFDDQLESESV